MSSVWQVILAAGAAMVTVAALWRKVLRPIVRFLATADQLLPLLVDLQAQLGGTPGAFTILKEIVGQLRTDSGSSLRDIVNRLDEAARLNATAAEVLKVNVEVVKELAREDRELARNDRQLLADLIAMVRAGGATGLRIEEAAGHVAEDLAERYQRADDIHPSEAPGVAADAASRPPDG